MAQIVSWDDTTPDTRSIPALERSSLGRDMQVELIFGEFPDMLPELAEKLHGCFEPRGLKHDTSLPDYNELAEIGGEAQDADGSYIPREGWEHVERDGVLSLMPMRGNPLGAYRLALQRTASFRRIRGWLEQNCRVEAGS